MTSQQPGYSSEFIYIPPLSVDESTKEKIRFLTPAKVVDLRNEENLIRCLDCEATSHWADLQNVDFSRPDTDLVQAMSKMQSALIWILENNSWGSA